MLQPNCSTRRHCTKCVLPQDKEYRLCTQTSSMCFHSRFRNANWVRRGDDVELTRAGQGRASLPYSSRRGCGKGGKVGSHRTGLWIFFPPGTCPVFPPGLPIRLVRQSGCSSKARIRRSDALYLRSRLLLSDDHLHRLYRVADDGRCILTWQKLSLTGASFGDAIARSTGSSACSACCRRRRRASALELGQRTWVQIAADLTFSRVTNWVVRTSPYFFKQQCRNQRLR